MSVSQSVSPCQSVRPGETKSLRWHYIPSSHLFSFHFCCLEYCFFSRFCLQCIIFWMSTPAGTWEFFFFSPFLFCFSAALFFTFSLGFFTLNVGFYCFQCYASLALSQCLHHCYKANRRRWDVIIIRLKVKRNKNANIRQIGGECWERS